jgi:hypothetical protein
MITEAISPLRQRMNPGTVEIGNNSPTKAFRQTESSLAFPVTTAAMPSCCRSSAIATRVY